MAPTILRDIKGGLVASTACIAFSVANGALIYSGTLQPMLARGIGAGLLTTAIVCLALALTSSFRPVVSTANSATAAPLGAIMASMTPALETLSQNEAIGTVYAFVAITTLVTGIALFLLGFARMGRIVRFVPHPVVAGFMGVSGTLLIIGAVRFGTAIPLAWRDLPTFLAPVPLAELSAMIAFAVCTTFVTRRARHPLALPALLVATVVLANLVVHAGVLPLDDALIETLFLAPKTPMPVAAPILFDPSTPVAWDVIWPYLPAIVGYALLVIMSTLLTSVGLETALNVDVSFDRELRAQGAAVIASGLAGGFVGNASVGSTLAGVASGARGRLTGIMAGLAAFAVLLLGRPLLPLIPRFVIAGFLLEIGFSIVMNWCVATRKQMPFGEWLLVIAIVLITVWVGLVAAIVAGIVGGCILFALDLSRIDIVRREYGLDHRASSLVRASEEMATLSHHGAQVRFIELSGTLFFGSAYQVLGHVRRLLTESTPMLIVLDLTRVIGGDSSTAAILARMRRLLSERGIAFAIAGARPQIVELLRAAGVLGASDPVYASRDAALEAGETLILKRFGSISQDARSLSDWLDEALNDAALAQALIPHLSRRDHDVGEYLCREGEPTTTLLFIESGRVAVMVHDDDAEARVRVFGPRTIAGEHGFVLALPRTASLVVEEPARVWSLERADFDRLTQAKPDLIIALMRHIVQLQSERLAFATRQNRMLS